MPWRCAGCGIEVPDDLAKQCGCVTMVACRGGETRWMTMIATDDFPADLVERCADKARARNRAFREDILRSDVIDAVAIALREAGVAEMAAALEHLLHAVCGETGFAAAVRVDTGTAYPWDALDLAEAESLAALSLYRKGDK